MQARRVAVTGLGVISALGANRHEFWEALVAGRHGFRPIEAVDRSRLCARTGAEVAAWNPALLAGKRIKTADRFAQFALLAADEAASDAGITWTDDLRRRTAVIVGSCVGGQGAEDRVFEEIYRKGNFRLHPLTISRVMANAGASHITIHFQTTGPAYTVSSACSSANHAIGQAFALVRQGSADLAITGGSDAPFSLGHLAAWDAMRALAPDVCRPFSRHRRGMILAEGGAMLVLEPMEAARARGARIYGEIVGFGMTADPGRLAESTVEGSAAAMRAALADGGIAAEEIGYINAHGTGTIHNDVMECKAIREVFGVRADGVPISSTKSMHGHALGAAGALEAVATLLALRDGVLPPTANFVEPDPECDLDVIPNEARRRRVEYALSNSFALGGLNAVLAFRGPWETQ